MSTEPSGVPETVSYEGVGLTYSTASGPVQALTDITLAVPRGHFVSMVGPSGCGKSSLLMLTAGLRSCTHGQIRIDGTPITGPQPNSGIVFQNDTLLDWRSALANVLLQVELRGLAKEQYRQKALDLLRSVGLGGFGGPPPHPRPGAIRPPI